MKTLIDIANEVHIDLGEPTDTTVVFLTSWFRANIGNLNSLLHTCYTINETSQEVDPKFGEEESSIFKEMFLSRHYSRKMEAALRNSLTDNRVLEVLSSDRRVKLTNPKDIAQSYLQLKNAADQNLKLLIASYQMHTSEPKQITGDDAGDC